MAVVHEPPPDWQVYARIQGAIEEAVKFYKEVPPYMVAQCLRPGPGWSEAQKQALREQLVGGSEDGKG